MTASELTTSEPVEHIEFLVEELSMETFLRGLLPQILGSVSYEIYSSQGKQDLLANLPQRLHGYSRWLPKTWRLVILVDRDDDDCHVLKKQLEDAARDADLPSRSTASDSSYSVVNRVAVEELEAWFFGDWEAVCEAYPAVSPAISRKARFRDPDAIRGGTWEALERILKRAGYFEGGLRKIEVARNLAPLVEPERNRSQSFSIFLNTVKEMVSTD